MKPSAKNSESVWYLFLYQTAKCSHHHHHHRCRWWSPSKWKENDRNRFLFSSVLQSANIPELQTNNRNEIILYVSAKNTQFPLKITCEFCVRVCEFVDLVVCFAPFARTSKQTTEILQHTWREFLCNIKQAANVLVSVWFCACAYKKAKAKIQTKIKKINNQFGFDLNEVSSALNVVEHWISGVQIRCMHYMWSSSNL